MTRISACPTSRGCRRSGTSSERRRRRSSTRTSSASAATWRASCPALRDRVPDLPSPRESDPETERYLLYAAVAGLLEGAGEQEPLLLILDDLHWADAPTLSLLRHVRHGRRLDARCWWSGPTATPTSRAIIRSPRCWPTFTASRAWSASSSPAWTREEVLALMEAAAGHELDEDGRALAAEITRETAGNPFFAGELLRHLTESGAIVQEQDGRWRLAGRPGRARAAPERARGDRAARGAPRPRRAHGAQRRRGDRARLRPRPAARGARAPRGAAARPARGGSRGVAAEGEQGAGRALHVHPRARRAHAV